MLGQNVNAYSFKNKINEYRISDLINKLESYDELTLTVTGYNTTTVIEPVSVGSSCPGYVMGDMNGNSNTNIQDIVILINVVLDLVDPDSCQVIYGDLNSDGISNILDVILLVNIILDN